MIEKKVILERICAHAQRNFASVENKNEFNPLVRQQSMFEDIKCRKGLHRIIL